jgi:hypothetical protein
VYQLFNSPQVLMVSFLEQMVDDVGETLVEVFQSLCDSLILADHPSGYG